MRKILAALTLAGLSVTAASAADVSAGNAIYQTACKSCHGSDGEANPSVAKMMKVEIKDLKSAAVQAASDDDIRKIITGGKGKMHAVTAVKGAEVDNVIAYVRTLKK
jgi:mono/diheme cytochrome c family protein